MGKRKYGFTLAEVLITLTILGVIATISISNLIQNFQKQQTLVGVKMAYSMLTEVLRRSQAENGTVSTWDMSLSNAAFFNKYFRPYLSVSKNCGSSNVPTEPSEQCFFSEHAGWYDILGVEQYTGGGIITGYYYYRVILKNGMSLGLHKINFLGVPSNRIFIAVDINGKKGKSIVGKDVFFFTIIPNAQYNASRGGYTDITGEILPGFIWHGYRTKLSSYYQTGEMYFDINKILSEDCSKTANASEQYKIAGGLCARALELNGWKMPKDYPW